MTESDGVVRCPRGHLTAAGYEYCTTCGERIAPKPVVIDTPRPQWADERIGSVPPSETYEPSRGASNEGVLPGDVPTGDVRSARARLRTGIGRLRRKPPNVTEPRTEGSLSLLPPDLLQVPNEPSVVGPPEIEPPLPSALRPSIYSDVEFAIGPASKSLVTFERPDPSAPMPVSSPKTRRRPEIPTSALIAILVVAAAIAAVIIVSVMRDPSTPAGAPTPLPTASAPATASPVGATASPVGTPAFVVVSEECVNAFAFAAAHAAEAQAPMLQERTLDLCTTTGEWVAAGRIHPAAIGVTDAAQVGEDDLARVCAGSPSAVLCQSIPSPSARSPSVASPSP